MFDTFKPRSRVGDESGEAKVAMRCMILSCDSGLDITKPSGVLGGEHGEAMVAINHQ